MLITSNFEGIVAEAVVGETQTPQLEIRANGPETQVYTCGGLS